MPELHTVPVNAHGRPGWFLGRPLASPMIDACPRMQELTGYVSLQAELDNGESVKSLRRFNRLLSNLPADSWGEGLPTEAHAEQGQCGLSAEFHCPAEISVHSSCHVVRHACFMITGMTALSLSCPAPMQTPAREVT